MRGHGPARRPPMRRSSLRLIAVGIVACVSAATPIGTSAATAPPLPDRGALFGAHVPVHARTASTRPAAIAGFEQLIGRPAAIDRQYYLWDQPWPTLDDVASRDAGRLLFLSWNAKRTNKTLAPWATIASGSLDAVIDARAADVAAFDAPVIVSFNHEPENDAAAGSPADYVAAFRHVRERFIAVGATNAIFAWTVMAWSFRKGTSAAYYPGDDAVDVIAGDGYNWYGCSNPTGPWRSFTEVFSAWHAWGAARGKPMIIAEWGTGEDRAVPGRKATWIDLAATQLKLWPDIVGVAYFHHDRGCARWVDSSTSSLDAFRAMGADPYFSPEPEIEVTSGPPVETSMRTATFTFSSGAASGFRCSLDGGTTSRCDGGTVTYSSMLPGIHRFEVVGVDPNGDASTGTARWTWSIAPAAPVVVKDFTYAPATKYPSFGETVLFSFVGPSDHSVRDTSGMGLFDTGVQPSGTVVDFTVPSAGTFAFACAIHPTMKGSLKAGVRAAPSAGIATTTFSVRWALGSPPIGYAYDVQVQRPGSTTWKMFANDTTLPSATFLPDAGSGTYRFRARLQRLQSKASGYSGSVAIAVG
jgi:plastocyanin